MRPTASGTIEETSTPGEKADRYWTNVIIDHKTLSESRERSCIYCQLASIEIDDIDFRLLWSKAVALLG